MEGGFLSLQSTDQNKVQEVSGEMLFVILHAHHGVGVGREMDNMGKQT